MKETFSLSFSQAALFFLPRSFLAGCHQIYTTSWRCEWQALIDRSQSMDVLSVNSRKNGGCAKIEEDQKRGGGEFWPAEMLHSEDTSNCMYYIRSFPKSVVDPVKKSLGAFSNDLSTAVTLW